MIELYIALGAIALIILWLILIYNKLVRLKNLVHEGWSGIDVQLKRRSNLIPNLIQAVKGYMKHERDLLERVTEMRAESMNAEGTAQRAEKEGALGAALANIFAVAENYPDLKASANFTGLQNELSEIEHQIQLARRYYNGAVRDLNIYIESFPSNIVATAFKFLKAEFFEIADQAERMVPKVDFQQKR